MVYDLGVSLPSCRSHDIPDSHNRDKTGTCTLMIIAAIQSCKPTSSTAKLIHSTASTDRRGGNSALFRVVYRDGKPSAIHITQVTTDATLFAGILYYIYLASMFPCFYYWKRHTR
jgi:hypothetical protein